MAFNVTTRTLENGSKVLIAQFVGWDSAATAGLVEENAVAKVTTATYAPTTHLKVRRILYSVSNANVLLQWKATTSTDIAVLGSGYGDLNFDYTKSGSQGIWNDGGTGVDGQITFTTTAILAAAGGGYAGYTITLFMTKGT